jgi:DNA-binding response OmpR family regulator
VDLRNAYSAPGVKFGAAVAVVYDTAHSSVTAAARALLKSSGRYRVVPSGDADLAARHSEGADPDIFVLVCHQRSQALARLVALRGACPNSGIVVVSADPRAKMAASYLEAGADEYVRVPLDTAELLGTIDRLARRLATVEALSAEVQVHSDSCAVRFGERKVLFKKTSFSIVQYLCERAGSWVTSEELRRNVLRTNYCPGASNIRWHVLQAREALSAHSWALHGDNRKGYMFKMAGCGLAHCHRSKDVPLHADSSPR